VESVNVGGAELLQSEAVMVHALRSALLADAHAQVFLAGDAAQFEMVSAQHRAHRGSLTLVVPQRETSGKRQLIEKVRTSLVESASALAISRDAAQCLVDSPTTGNLKTIPTVVAVCRAEGFEVNLMETGDQHAALQVDLSKSEQAAIRKRAAQISRGHRQDQTVWAKRSPVFAGQGAEAGSTYAGGQELHSLSKSVRFHRWMAHMLRPAMGTALSPRVLEVGAGIGTMTKALAETYPQAKILSIEPDPALFDLLNERVGGTGVETSVLSTHEIGTENPFDTLLYVNVLEHIEDHVGELKRAYELLKPGGRVGIIVPAIPSLYGSLDAKTGHFRRYRKEALKQVAEQAGFTVTDLHYFDAVGVLPYWATIKVGAMPALSDRTTFLFDNVLVPMSKVAHRVWKQIPIGKNLLLVATRPN
jgi:SAM-dependent methyltransferase